MVGPVGLPGAADLYYENRGDGTFAEVAEAPTGFMVIKRETFRPADCRSLPTC